MEAYGLGGAIAPATPELAWTIGANGPKRSRQAIAALEKTAPLMSTT
jgi:hypothetical protein